MLTTTNPSSSPSVDYADFDQEWLAEATELLKNGTPFQPQHQYISLINRIDRLVPENIAGALRAVVYAVSGSPDLIQFITDEVVATLQEPRYPRLVNHLVHHLAEQGWFAQVFQLYYANGVAGYWYNNTLPFLRLVGHHEAEFLREKTPSGFLKTTLQIYTLEGPTNEAFERLIKTIGDSPGLFQRALNSEGQLTQFFHGVTNLELRPEFAATRRIIRPTSDLQVRQKDETQRQRRHHNTVQPANIGQGIESIATYAESIKFIDPVQYQDQLNAAFELTDTAANFADYCRDNQPSWTGRIQTTREAILAAQEGWEEALKALPLPEAFVREYLEAVKIISDYDNEVTKLETDAADDLHRLKRALYWCDQIPHPAGRKVREVQLIGLYSCFLLTVLHARLFVLSPKVESELQLDIVIDALVLLKNLPSLSRRPDIPTSGMARSVEYSYSAYIDLDTRSPVTVAELPLLGRKRVSRANILGNPVELHKPDLPIPTNDFVPRALLEGYLVPNDRQAMCYDLVKAADDDESCSPGSLRIIFSRSQIMATYQVKPRAAQPNPLAVGVLHNGAARTLQMGGSIPREIVELNEASNVYVYANFTDNSLMGRLNQARTLQQEFQADVFELGARAYELVYPRLAISNKITLNDTTNGLAFLRAWGQSCFEAYPTVYGNETAAIQRAIDDILAVDSNASLGVAFNSGGSKQKKVWELAGESDKKSVTRENLQATMFCILDNALRFASALMIDSDVETAIRDSPAAYCQAKPKEEVLTRTELEKKSRFIYAVNQDAQFFPKVAYNLFTQSHEFLDWSDFEQTPPANRVFSPNANGQIGGVYCIWPFSPIDTAQRLVEGLIQMREGDIKLMAMSDNIFSIEKVNDRVSFYPLDGRSYEVSARKEDINDFFEYLSRDVDLTHERTASFYEAVHLMCRNFVNPMAVFGKHLLNVPGQASGTKITSLVNYNTSSKVLVLLAELVNLCRDGPVVHSQALRDRIMRSTTRELRDAVGKSLNGALLQWFRDKRVIDFGPLFKVVGVELKFDCDPSEVAYSNILHSLYYTKRADIDVLGFSIVIPQQDLNPIFVLHKERLYKSLVTTNNAFQLFMHLEPNRRKSKLRDKYLDHPLELLNIVAAELAKLMCLQVFGGFLGSQLPVIINSMRLQYLRLLAATFKVDTHVVIELLNAATPDPDQFAVDEVTQYVYAASGSPLVSSSIYAGMGLRTILDVHRTMPDWENGDERWAEISSVTPVSVNTGNILALSVPDALRIVGDHSAFEYAFGSGDALHLSLTPLKERAKQANIGGQMLMAGASLEGGVRNSTDKRMQVYTPSHTHVAQAMYTASAAVYKQVCAAVDDLICNFARPGSDPDVEFIFAMISTDEKQHIRVWLSDYHTLSGDDDEVLNRACVQARPKAAKAIAMLFQRYSCRQDPEGAKRALEAFVDECLKTGTPKVFELTKLFAFNKRWYRQQKVKGLIHFVQYLQDTNQILASPIFQLNAFAAWLVSTTWQRLNRKMDSPLPKEAATPVVNEVNAKTYRPLYYCDRNGELVPVKRAWVPAHFITTLFQCLTRTRGDQMTRQQAQQLLRSSNNIVFYFDRRAEEVLRQDPLPIMLSELAFQLKLKSKRQFTCASWAHGLSGPEKSARAKGEVNPAVYAMIQHSACEVLRNPRPQTFIVSKTFWLAPEKQVAEWTDRRKPVRLRQALTTFNRTVFGLETAPAAKQLYMALEKRFGEYTARVACNAATAISQAVSASPVFAGYIINLMCVVTHYSVQSVNTYNATPSNLRYNVQILPPVDRKWRPMHRPGWLGLFNHCMNQAKSRGREGFFEFLEAFCTHFRLPQTMQLPPVTAARFLFWHLGPLSLDPLNVATFDQLAQVEVGMPSILIHPNQFVQVGSTVDATMGAETVQLELTDEHDQLVNACNLIYKKQNLRGFELKDRYMPWQLYLNFAACFDPKKFRATASLLLKRQTEAFFGKDECLRPQSILSTHTIPYYDAKMAHLLNKEDLEFWRRLRQTPNDVAVASALGLKTFVNIGLGDTERALSEAQLLCFKEVDVAALTRTYPARALRIQRERDVQWLHSFVRDIAWGRPSYLSTAIRSGRSTELHNFTNLQLETV